MAGEGNPVSRTERLMLGAVIVFSAAIGVACLIQFSGSPFYRAPMIDEAAYVAWAEEIAGGDWLGGEVFYQAPLYPYFLAIVFSFGKGLAAVRALQLLMGTASVCLVYWTARRLAGPGAALSAALLIALYHGLYFFDLLILKAATLTALSALACALGVFAAERPERLSRWPALGGALGLLILLRGNFLIVAPLILVWSLLWPNRGRMPLGWAATGALVLGAAVVLVPVAARNLYVSDEFTLTTSQGGSNFYIGNNDLADGGYVTLPFAMANPRYQSEDFRAEAGLRSGRTMSHGEASRFWLGEGLRWMRDNPGRAARLWAVKARLLISQREVPNNHSFYLVRDEFVPALWVPFLGFGILAPLALAGMWVTVRRERRALFPALFLIGYAASLIPFFIVARYRMAMVPAMTIFGGCFLAWAGDALRRRDAGKLAMAGGALAVLAAMGFMPVGDKDYLHGQGYYLLGGAYYKDGAPGRSLSWFGRAIEVLADDGQAKAAWEEAARATGMDQANLLVAVAAIAAGRVKHGKTGQRREEPRLLLKSKLIRHY